MCWRTIRSSSIWREKLNYYNIDFYHQQYVQYQFNCLIQAVLEYSQSTSFSTRPFFAPLSSTSSMFLFLLYFHRTIQSKLLRLWKMCITIKLKQDLQFIHMPAYDNCCLTENRHRTLGLSQQIVGDFYKMLTNSQTRLDSSGMPYSAYNTRILDRIFAKSQMQWRTKPLILILAKQNKCSNLLQIKANSKRIQWGQTVYLNQRPYLVAYIENIQYTQLESPPPRNCNGSAPNRLMVVQ